MVKRKGKKGKSARSAQKGIGHTEPEELVKAPHSFVINRGKLGKNANELMINFRKLMEPFTASHLKVQKQNVIKDFIHIAGPLNVSHLVIFTKSQTHMYLRMLKLPRGPTLTYQIKEYSLMKDIVSSQKKPMMYEKLFAQHPLLVLNNFSGEGMHLKLMATMFQNMFPSINVNKTNLNTIRRCLLLNNTDEGIDLRQYAIKIIPAGVSKAVKKLVQSKVPDLGQYQNVDEFMQKSGNLSESEVELDSAANTVVLPQPISSRGNIASEKSAIRLYEIGPRLKLELIKIEEGLMNGEVMYHKFIQRTPEEVKALKKRIEAKKLLKARRKAEQERNVERKKLAAKESEGKEKEAASGDESEDDREWYKAEVGEEPDDSVLPGIMKKRKLQNNKEKPSKKVKFSTGKPERKENQTKTGTSKDKTEGKTVQEFLKRRKKRKESKLAKKKAKRMSHKVLSLRAKHRETSGKKFKKKKV